MMEEVRQAVRFISVRLMSPLNVYFERNQHPGLEVPLERQGDAVCCCSACEEERDVALFLISSPFHRTIF